MRTAYSKYSSISRHIPQLPSEILGSSKPGERPGQTLAFSYIFSVSRIDHLVPWRSSVGTSQERLEILG
jgi:hypothetical protein